MTKIKRILSVLLASLLLLIPASTAFAGGEGSITVNNITAGRTYRLYKVFDLNYSATGGKTAAAYTIDPDWSEFFTTGAGSKYIVDNQAGSLNQISVTSGTGTVTKYINITENNVAQFAQDSYAYAAGNTAPAKDAEYTVPVTSKETSYTFTGLDLGYYLVQPVGATDIIEGNNSICSLTSTAPTATVNLKATYPDVTKNILQKNGKDLPAGSVSTSAGVGDTITYTVKGTVPDMTGFNKYIYQVIDTMSNGLTYIGDNNVQITIGGETVNVGEDVTVTSTVDQATGKTTTTFNFAGIMNYQAKAGKEIVIKYSALVDQDAIVDVAAEENSVILRYSGDPENPDITVDTPERKTDVYTTDLMLTKIDGADMSKKLTGAKFKIEGESGRVVIVNKETYQESATGTYYRLKNGKYTTDAPVEGTKALYESETVKYAKVNTIDTTNQNSTFVQEGWVGEGGLLSFNGLGEGTYKITELVSPEGYNLLTKPITVAVSFDSATKTFSANVDGKAAKVENGIIYFDVINNSGALLPDTGGIGTTIFFILGGALAGGGVAFILIRRRIRCR